MIAVDAMGGDFAPAITVQGAYNAAKKGIKITLFGQKAVLVDLLKKIDQNWRSLPLDIVDCPESIGMAEEPTRSVLKKNSSLMRALHAVKNQQAQAVVTAGNSGSAVVGSILVFERLKGVARPALGTFLPTQKGSVFLLDIGANVDCKPDFLQQFACMGHAFVSFMSGIAQPRVGLLSNGHERGKGSYATKVAYTLLEHSSINFIGNVEAREIFNDYADVIVCDGFVGNVVLKSVQGATHALTGFMKTSFSSSVWGRCVGLLAKPFFKKVYNAIDYKNVGGALLLGVHHPLVVAHGCSNSDAFENAITFAHRVVTHGVVEKFNDNLIKLLDREQVIKQTLTLSSHEMVVS